jgi:GDSL-like Lipase/Acylhydrolase family
MLNHRFVAFHTIACFRFAFGVLVAFAFEPCFQNLYAQDDLLAPYREKAIAEWSDELQAFKERNLTEQHPDDAILFVGSSSIRLWDSIAEDIAPFHPVRRGFGGSRFSDIAVFADELITPHKYQALVLFAANDVTGDNDDISAEEVSRLVRFIVERSRQHNAVAPILIIEITPTEKRFQAWEKIRRVNAGLREICLTERNVFFVPTAEQYLTVDKQPRPELFDEDKLHQNRTGYQLWGSIIGMKLSEVLAR